MSRLQLVSVIFTTKNEQGMIGKALESVFNQTYLHIEIIVVDNNSTDQTKQIARRKKIKLYNFGPERSAQRNFGVKKAKGRYILILDADMELTSDIVDECVKAVHKDEEIAALIAPEKSRAASFWEKVKAFERSFYNLEGDIFTDAARFFKKEIFLKVGGYDEAITGPEDWDLTERIRESGYKIGRIKNFIYHQEKIKSLYDLARKKFYYGLKTHQYLDKNKLPLIGPKTVYFLRPLFYKKLHKLASNPILSVGMFILLTVELIAGGLGYMVGRVKFK